MRWALALIVLGACGDGVPAPDAAAPDAGAAGLVRVRFAGSDRENQRVLFQDADSNVVLSTRTDAEGRANAYMSYGGYATLVIAAPEGRRIYTWAGVRPGDDLVLEEQFPTPAISHPVQLSIPSLPDGLNYNLFTPCTMSPAFNDSIDVTSAAAAPTIEYLFDCGDTADLLVIPNAGTPQYVLAHDARVVGDTAVAIPGPYRPWSSSSVVAYRIPETWSGIVVERTLVNHGVGYYSAPGREWVPGPERMVADNLTFVMPPEATLRVDVSQDGSTDAALVQFRAAHWGPPQDFTAFDLGAIDLPRITSAPFYDPGGALRWTEGPGPHPDAALARWEWSKPELGGRVTWLIAAPRGNDAWIRLPVLPDDLRPDLEKTMPLIDDLATFRIPGGYDAVRARILGDGTFQRFPTYGDSGDVITQTLAPH